MGQALAIAGALAGLVSAGAATIGAFKSNSPTSSNSPTNPLSPSVSSPPPGAQSSARQLGALALTSTGPQGLTSAPTTGRSKLLGY